MTNFVFQVKADLTMSQLEKSDQNETRISHYEVNLVLVKLVWSKTFYTRATFEHWATLVSNYLSFIHIANFIFSLFI